MNKEELVKVIESHGKWLKYEEGGIRADLQDANLQEADLHGVDLQNTDLRWVDLREADLRRANLQGVDLRWADLRWADLQGADLHGADLQDANLQGVDFREADLRWANLQWTDLQGADLRRANLQGANLDFSCLPLHCNSFGMVVDDRLVLQLFAHIVRLDTRFCSEGVKEIVRNLSELAKNGFIKYHEEVEKIYR